MNQKCDLGVIGLAVMGQNLVLNMIDKGYRVAGYNRTESVTKKFVEKRAKNKNFAPAYELEELINNLKKPRKIFMLVKAGQPVEMVIDQLIPLLEEKDIIMDGGNSYFKDTENRFEKLADQGIRYLGVGVSGGEYGALHGPSMMPGGDLSAFKEVEEIFQATAARVAYLGPRGAGHYVKMVHNGIEYGIMEIISEIYDIMRKNLSLDYKKMSSLFGDWNREHESYLMEITEEILRKKDSETDKPLLEVILDKAGQKGTGKWSAREGLNLGIPMPTISAGVRARFFSALKEERKNISRKFKKEVKNDEKDKILNLLPDSLYVAIIIAYTEGMKLLEAASREYEYNLDLAEIARIWEKGCIIRASHLKLIQQAINQHKPTRLKNLLLAPVVRKKLSGKISSLRTLIKNMKQTGIPLPALNGALDFIDSFSSQRLPANMIQAQRDYFGAHTYERVDKKGTFHTEWQDIHNIT